MRKRGSVELVSNTSEKAERSSSLSNLQDRCSKQNNTNDYESIDTSNSASNLGLPASRTMVSTILAASRSIRSAKTRRDCERIFALSKRDLDRNSLGFEVLFFFLFFSNNNYHCSNAFSADATAVSMSFASPVAQVAIESSVKGLTTSLRREPPKILLSIRMPGRTDLEKKKKTHENKTPKFFPLCHSHFREFDCYTVSQFQTSEGFVFCMFVCFFLCSTPLL